MKDPEKIRKQRNRYITIFVVLSLLILLLPVALTHRGFQFWDLTGQESAHIGDALGGMTAPFLAIGAAVLTFIAFWVQYVYNIEQKDDLSVERFEHNLFELMNHQETIINGLSIELDDEIETEISVESQVNKFTGRDVFEALYRQYVVKVYYMIDGDYVPKSAEYVGLKELFEKDDNCYDHYVSDKSVGRLDHYFRHLYHIFRYIKKSQFTDDEKYRYASLVRSNLSQYELVLLFYNCLSSNGIEKFKTLVEDFALLNNLRVQLLAKDVDRQLYRQKMQEGYVDNPNIPQTEYSVKAFRYQENMGR